MKWLLRIFFRLLYHEFAWSYDLVANLVSFGRWQEWVRSVIPFLSEGAVLEIGSGPGHLQLALLDRGRQAYGLELSPQMLGQSSRRLRQAGFQPSLIRGDGRFLPFRDGAVPNVIATFPTEYLFQPDTLKEIARVLAPAGKLIVLPMVFITGRGIMHRFIAWLYRVTGQSLPQEAVLNNDLFAAFTASGFQVSQHLVEERGASLLVIEAVLPEAENN